MALSRLLTIRVRNTASVMRNLQTAQDELVGALFQPMQVKAMPNSVWQSWHPLPVCFLHHLELYVSRACCGTASPGIPAPGIHRSC